MATCPNGDSFVNLQLVLKGLEKNENGICVFIHCLTLLGTVQVSVMVRINKK